MEVRFDKELENCNFIKTILMILVVVYHSILFWSGSWFVVEPMYDSKFLVIIARWLNSFHIYAFTFVSGYLFYFLKYEQGKYEKITSFIWNKIKRLYIPYIFVSFTWVIPFAIYFFQYDIWKIREKFVLGTSPSQLWFLLMLLCVFIMFYLFADFYKKNHIAGMIVGMLFYCIGLIGQKMIPNYFQFFSGCMYIPLFWLGFKIRQCGSDIIKRMSALFWIVLDVVLFSVRMGMEQHQGMLFTVVRLALDLLLHIVGALMAFVVLQKMADNVNWKESKLFMSVAKKSMSIYLFHQQIIYIFLYLLNGRLNPYIHSLVNFLGAMAVSLLISAVMMKFRITRFLIGEK